MNAWRQRGVGLIEVLIAIVVVALGVLAIIRMQTSMVQANQSALLRSQATFLVYDMADRLRVDRQSAITGLYNRDFDEELPAAVDVVGTETRDWLERIDDVLPAGQGSIASNGVQVTVSVRWDDSRGDEALEVFSMTTEL